MRKAQKEQVEELLKLLEQAHEEIKRNIEKRNFEPVLVTLADCQDCAVAMGNLIEESEGENFVTISFLEKYCEAVYQIYQSIANGENIDVNKTEKSLRKGLIAAENSIRNDIKIRKEVVFFPYKASMWDSLESVYLAAKADPDCDAYCVPIPYFDKNPDGTVKEMHYEGREYPANIEIIDWQSYNFEERKPDVIYIHNPYDQFNYVTSVHPRFYASNLQKYTNELVYIPYFVLTEIEPDDQAAIEGMKHFCYLPGTIYADKVILQSENMRQIYINEYMKACKRLDDQELRKDLEKRFLGTGSPKFDKVLNTKREDLEIPEDWLKIIEKPDGSLKKIIFYNTSIGALLQHDEKMLEKMKSVFATFKENKDEVALLWRPHPLIQATIESMRPQLWAQYKEIVEQYKAEGWGIYDDSADLDRAVVLSDAYYGDWSSVVELCQKVGKIVMIQNVYMISGEEFENACLCSRCIEFDDENDVMWLVTNNTSTLLKVDLKTGSVLSIFQIPVERIKDYDFVEMHKIEQCLFLLPHNTNKFYCFFIEKEEFAIIDLPLTPEERNVPKKFKKMLFRNDHLYLIGHNLNLILKIYLCNHQVTRIENFLNDTKVLAWDGIFVDDDLYIPLAEENVILKLNTEMNFLEKINIDSNQSKGFSTITMVNQKLLLTDWENNRIQYCLGSHTIEICKLEAMACKLRQYEKYAKHQQYQKVLCYQGKEYYFSTYEDSIMVRNQNGTSRFLTYHYPYDLRLETAYSKFELIKMYDDAIFFQARTSGDIFKIDLDTDQVCTWETHITPWQKVKIVKEVLRYNKREVFFENDIFNINLCILCIGEEN